MQGSIPEDKIDEIKRRIDIVDLVAGYVNLKQAGRNFIGLCPFHQEKTPSFTVNREKQIFYCFGCGEGGNAVTFVMKQNGLSFPEAIRHLARKTGVVLPTRSLSDKEKGELSRRERMLRLHRTAAAFFSERLEGREGAAARQYLRERGISETTAKEFRLGYSPPGWRQLRDYLDRKRMSLDLAERAGLLVKNERGDFHDRFRGRLVFPIEDPYGQIVAFGGRIMGEGMPKYLNSPESALFSKGRNLYGLAKAREAIRKSGSVILVEGYFDLLALWNADIRNVAATLGTALTRDHVELLRRSAPKAAVVFDGDEAGKKALARSLALFVEVNLPMRAVVLPQDADPDDCVRGLGREAFLDLVAAAPPAVEYYVDNFIGNPASMEDGREALRAAMAFIGKMEGDAERNLFVRRVAQRLGVDEAVLQKEVNRGRGRKTTAPEREARTPPSAASAAVDGLEASLIALLLDHPRMIPAVVAGDALTYLQNEELRGLGAAAAAQYERRGGIDLEDFVARLGPGALREAILSRLVDSASWEGETADRICRDMIRQIKRRWFKERRRSLNASLVRAQQAMDAESCRRLLAEKTELIEKEKSMLSNG
ncbi:MAG: DNA primase [Pseudomonadota bacterium]|nr:DNA primase [Pseudomonadota bacterium]